LLGDNALEAVATASGFSRRGLFYSMYGRVLIPTEVQFEVTVGDRDLRGASEIRNAKWIEVVSPKSTPEPKLAQACQKLGVGERGAIYLAKSLVADLVLSEMTAGRAFGLILSNTCWMPRVSPRSPSMRAALR
jgi:predicted nucleic acid-binding protein